jgi:hypothetical protein
MLKGEEQEYIPDRTGTFYHSLYSEGGNGDGRQHIPQQVQLKSPIGTPGDIGREER